MGRFIIPKGANAEAAKALAKLPADRYFFERAFRIGVSGKEETLVGAAHKCNAMFSKLPEGYFDGKDFTSYKLFVTFPLYVTLVGNIDSERARHSMLEALWKDDLSLYVDASRWCVRKCHYCYAGPEKLPARVEVERYHDAMKEEYRMYQRFLEGDNFVTSVYFGGGTPTILPAEPLVALIRHFKDTSNLRQGSQITCEASPETIDLEKLRAMAREIDRISIGAQVLEDDLLRFCNRAASAKKTENAIRMALGEFNHVNVDLIYGLPGQTMGHWMHTLDRAVELSPHSFSVYRYGLKRGSEFAKMLGEGRMDPGIFPHEQMCRLMFEMARIRLREAGYGEKGPLYWFTKPGITNEVYSHRWREGIATLGLGAGAYSLSPFSVGTNLCGENYLRAVRDGKLPVEKLRLLTPQERMAQYAWRKMRFADEINTDALFKRDDPTGKGSKGYWEALDSFAFFTCKGGIRGEMPWGDDPASSFRELLRGFESYGLLTINQNVAKLTEAGRMLVEWMIKELEEKFVGEKEPLIK